MKEMVFINGQGFVPEEARVSVFDRGFLYGDAIYEVTRSYGRILFQMEAHMDRLLRSAAALGMDLGLSRSELIDEIYRTHREADGENAYMRIQISRGGGPIGLDPSLASQTTRVIYLKPLPEKNPMHVAQGIDIAVTSVTRNSKTSLDPNIKSGNYLNNILAILKTPGRAVQEWIMIDGRGFVTEGTTSNIWFVKNGAVVGVPDSSDILFGITRQIVRESCRHLEIRLEEKTFTAEALRGADEVFITSSTREVMPVRSIDGQPVKTSPGPITRRLLDDYQRVIGEYCESARGRHPWSDDIGRGLG